MEHFKDNSGCSGKKKSEIFWNNSRKVQYVFAGVVKQHVHFWYHCIHIFIHTKKHTYIYTNKETVQMNYNNVKILARIFMWIAELQLNTMYIYCLGLRRMINYQKKP